MYPTLYEINTRPWIKQFGLDANLASVPDQYWKTLKSKGVDYIWLMGVWETSQASIPECCFHPDLVKAYNDVSTKWRSEDITGSPYAIEDYHVAKLLGTNSDLLHVKNQLNRLGLSLILDFVPNHFNAYSALVEKHPEVFLKAGRTLQTEEGNLFFKRGNTQYAHGKDPYFSPWSDTVQIDYFSAKAQQFMLDRLFHIAKFCDGVRCDMAMLILPDIFSKTWSFLHREHEVNGDFWSASIAKMKKKYPKFIFVAEAYWDTQWRLQQLGFDYTYDKTIIDRLVESKTLELKAHLSGSIEYQNKCLRFIENHDEARSISALGDERARVSAILYTTLPGMRLHYDGQWEGCRQKYPVQLGKYFNPDPCPCVIKSGINNQGFPCPCMCTFYEKLMEVVSQPIFKFGTWQLLETTSPNFIASCWKLTSQERVVVVNLGRNREKCRIKLPPSSLGPDITDLLTNDMNPSYTDRDNEGLTIDLPANKGCILSKVEI